MQLGHWLGEPISERAEDAVSHRAPTSLRRTETEAFASAGVRSHFSQIRAINWWKHTVWPWRHRLIRGIIRGDRASARLLHGDEEREKKQQPTPDHPGGGASAAGPTHFQTLTRPLLLQLPVNTVNKLIWASHRERREQPGCVSNSSGSSSCLEGGGNTF